MHREKSMGVASDSDVPVIEPDDDEEIVVYGSAKVGSAAAPKKGRGGKGKTLPKARAGKGRPPIAKGKGKGRAAIGNLARAAPWAKARAMKGRRRG